LPNTPRQSQLSFFNLGIVKENKKEILKISAIATVGSLMAAAVPLIYGKLFDSALIPNSSITFNKFSFNPNSSNFILLENVKFISIKYRKSGF
jgi:hypothetical protein